MTDLVERLNDAARLFEEHGDHKSLPREAADEIERLRAALEDAVETLEAVNLHGGNPLYNRLRAAVENKS